MYYYLVCFFRIRFEPLQGFAGMKKHLIISYIFLLSSLFILTQCSNSSGNSAAQLSNLYTASNYVKYVDIAPLSTTYTDLSITQNYNYFNITIPELNSGESVSFDYTFDTGSKTRDVYFIFTNIDTNSNSNYPLIDYNQSVSQSLLPINSSKSKALLSGKQIMKGKPEISEFNRHPFAYLNSINPVNMLLSTVSSAEPKYYDNVTDTTSFQLDKYSSVTATCTNVNTDGTKTLNVWVANNCGVEHNQPCTALSYQKPISDLANLFLKSGDNNDIYHWVTNIYGEEWPTLSEYNNLSQDKKDVLIIPDNNITILLLDIDNDKSPDSGVLGYYWAKDNFKTSAISYSNQRIMFYMDAYIYANNPDEIISALAHEFQHMIHFYQKTVLLTDGTGTETWIDEMCSMATEDLVADKLKVNGPRGVSYLDGSAGIIPPYYTIGRLPMYNFFNDASVTTWLSDKYVIISYSVNYALGAYLLRNYGGAKFFHDVVHNTHTDYTAIENALQQNGSSDSFGTILGKWGVASLLSYYPDTQSGYQYNIGNWFTSVTDPATVPYNAGSINMYNYKYDPKDEYGNPILSQPQVGPYLFSPDNPLPTHAMPPASNEYYKAADNLAGSKTWNIKLRNNVRMTVVAKE